MIASVGVQRAGYELRESIRQLSPVGLVCTTGHQARTLKANEHSLTSRCRHERVARILTSQRCATGKIQNILFSIPYFSLCSLYSPTMILILSEICVSRKLYCK